MTSDIRLSTPNSAKLASSSRPETSKAASVLMSRSALAVMLPEAAADSTDRAAASVATGVASVGRAGALLGRLAGGDCL